MNLRSNKTAIASTEKMEDYIIFLVGDELFALKLIRIHKIYESRENTERMIRYLDREIEVYNLKDILGTESGSNRSTNKSVILIISNAEETEYAAIQVDSAEEIRSMNQEDMKTIELPCGVDVREYILGAVQRNDRTIIVLDTERLLYELSSTPTTYTSIQATRRSL